MLKTYITNLTAIDPKDNKLKQWGGQNINAESFEEAQKWCDENAGYLTVMGELVEEIEIAKLSNN